MAYYNRELLRLLPRVLRARDFHLYLENGKRLTDLWLAGGRAVLGHKPPKVLGELKNAAERGLFTPFPHPMERRFVKALTQFFPRRTFRLYADPCSLYRALVDTGFAEPGIASPADTPFFDPAFFPPEPQGLQGGRDTNPRKADRRDAKISLWRPFLDTAPVKSSDSQSYGISYTTAPILIPILPWPLGPSVLVLDESLDTSFPPGELISPVLLAPATRALYDLAAAIKAKDPNRGSKQYQKIEKALNQTNSGRANSGGQKHSEFLWQRRGIYLTIEPDIAGEKAGEKYETLFRNFLEGGFLIPPSVNEPLILPGIMSKGEESKLAELISL